MELALIGIVALLTAGVTFVSGFGLGTILMPVFALFFPVPLAIAATAVVHLASNIFKFGLMAKQADWPVVARFGVPAAFAAIVEASLLTWFDRMPVVASYTIGGSVYEITAVKAVIGVLIVVFALLELEDGYPEWKAAGRSSRMWRRFCGRETGRARAAVRLSRISAAAPVSAP